MNVFTRNIHFAGVFLFSVLSLFCLSITSNLFLQESSQESQKSRIQALAEKKAQVLIHDIISTGLKNKKSKKKAQKYVETKIRNLAKEQLPFQLLIYQNLRHLNEKESWKIVILQKWLFEEEKIDKINVLRESIPYIRVKEHGFRRDLNELMGSLEGENFKNIKRVLIDMRADLPLPLVKYIYHKDPDSALNIMMDVFKNKKNHSNLNKISDQFNDVKNHKKKKAEVTKKIKAIRSNGPTQKNNEIGDLKRKHSSHSQSIRKNLVRMAASKVWWVRLYAAEMMRQYPKLRNGHIIQELKDDSHELVRETITSINK